MRLMVIGWTAVLAGCLSFVAPAGAGEGLDRLHAFFSDVRTLRAEFVQTLVNTELQGLQESTGTLLLQRPGKFRWDYRTPYEQIIVGDGEKVWSYDSDLAQVMVRNQDATLGSTPAMLLSGNRPLEDGFEIEEIGMREGLEWLELRPRAKESEFNLVRLGFGERDLKSMELVDGFGQVTRLRFERVERNPAIDASMFVFTVPEGADVIGDTDAP